MTLTAIFLRAIFVSLGSYKYELVGLAASFRANPNEYTSVSLIQDYIHYVSRLVKRWLTA